MAVTKAKFSGGRPGHVYIDQPSGRLNAAADAPGQGVRPGGDQSDIANTRTPTFSPTRGPQGGTLSALTAGFAQNQPEAQGEHTAVGHIGRLGYDLGAVAAPAGNQASTGLAGATPAGPTHRGPFASRPSQYSDTGAGKGQKVIRKYGGVPFGASSTLTPGDGGLGRTGGGSRG